MPKGIYPRTEFHRKRYGFQKGHKINLGRLSPILGMKWSDEQKVRLSMAMKGHSTSQETREKIRQAHLGMKPTEETRKKLRESHLGKSPGNKGKKTPRKVVERMRRTKLGDKLYEERRSLGLLNYTKVWDKLYPNEFIEIRKNVYKRDLWSCGVCGCQCNSVEGNTKIQCHHIDYNTKNNHTDNLITLCQSCHMKTNSSREYWEQYFLDKKGRVLLF